MVLSFFSGCGGLDLGFSKAGFAIDWANDNAKSVAETYCFNFPNTYFSGESINDIQIEDLPDNPIGIIGGPPCQSWSNAGKGRGFDDPRGKVFLRYIQILEKKQPLFVLAENVKGIMAHRNQESFNQIVQAFNNAGYSMHIECLNAANYEVAQNRDRVFFVGFRKDLNIKYEFPPIIYPQLSVRDVIQDLQRTAVPMGQKTIINAHEYWTGSYSYIFMSRNRVLDWNAPSYTIQASGRQTSIHPQAPLMEKVEKDVCRFIPGKENLYRRLTARECARIQGFPDSFLFHYKDLNDAYKMIGNAVPVNLAFHVANSIKYSLELGGYL